MHRLLVMGVSHRTAPVEVREALSVPAGELAPQLRRLLALTGAAECALLCTCNRVEAYLVDAPRAGGLAREWEARAGVPLDGRVYAREDVVAAGHLFRVAAGLDAMVTGETQVLGQVKQALEGARAAGTSGKVLGRLFAHAVRAARRVHAETSVRGRIASVSALAVEAALARLGSLGGRAVLVVGAGKMGRLALTRLRQEGAGEILVCTRDPARVRQLPPGCTLLPLHGEVLGDAFARVDLVLSCTAAPEPVIGEGLVARALPAREGRPLLVIDLAVPRDVEPAVGRLPGVELLDIDALDRFGDGAAREQVERAEAICAQEAGEFAAWLRQQRVVPVIRRVRERALRIRREELERAMRELPGLGERERRVLELMAHRLVNRVLDGPIAGLKGLAGQPGAEGAVEVLAATWEGRGRRDKRQQVAL